MIISDQHKFIILKNPKTAGTSLRYFNPFIRYGDRPYRILDQLSTQRIFAGMRQIPGMPPFNIRMPPPEVEDALAKRLSMIDDPIKKINEIVFACFPIYGNYSYYIDLDNKIKAEGSNFIFCDGRLDEYTAYVVMRDPIERFKSMVRHAKSKSAKGMIHCFYPQQFSRVLTDLDRMIIGATNNRRMFWPKPKPPEYSDLSESFRSLWESFSFNDIARKLLEGPIIDHNINARVNFLRIPQSYYCSDSRVKILNFSNLQSEIDGLCTKYNLPVNTLPRENTEKHSEDDVLSDDVLEKVKQVYEEDIEIYRKNFG